MRRLYILPVIDDETKPGEVVGLRRYDLTDRGKIIIAVILVTLIFVIPAIILAAKAWNSSPPPDDPPQTEVPGDPPPDISNTPLPDNGSGVDPNDPPKTGNGEQGSFDPPVEQPDDNQEFGPVDIDTSAGTMSFLYAPDLQSTLDTETISMMGDFITSPKNTADSQITVEMPQLSEEETSVLMEAISGAFAEHDVSQNDIKYVISASDPEERIFEVFLSFTRVTNLK